MRTIERGRRSLSVLAEHKYTTIAGTLVFFLIMSFVPLAFWLTLLFGGLGLDTDEILSLELFGWAADLLVFVRDNAEGATSGAGIFLLATTLWSSTGFFYHLRRSGEIIYGYRRAKKGWRLRLSAVVLTFLILLFLGGVGALLVGVIWMARFLTVWLFYPVVYSLILSVGFFTAWILNAYICPYHAKPSDTATGSILTAIAWMIASIAFSVYLNLGNKEQLYGALTTVIVFLLWLYWMMICFTAGVVYNCRRMEVKKMRHKKY